VNVKVIALSATVALVAGAAVLADLAQRPIIEEGSIIKFKEDHPVTPEMLEWSRNLRKEVAPTFTVTDAFGEKVTLASPQGTKPQFIYFIQDGCPCSVEVEPLFQDLQKRYKDKIDFIGVIDKDRKVARQWHTDYRMRANIVPDEKMAIIQAYKATNSAFSSLVTSDGRVVKAWPGYSIGILTEMNKLMAAEVGLKPAPFDTKYAPKKPLSGCRFEPK